MKKLKDFIVFEAKGIPSKNALMKIDSQCENLCIEHSDFFPADKVPYEEDSDEMEWLMENTDAIIKKPFDKTARKVLTAFGVDYNDVYVFRHTAVEEFDFCEVILYTPSGEDPEGMKHEYAVQDMFPTD